MTAGRDSRRPTLADAGVAVLAGILALAIYIRSLAPGLLWGDSAEFQMAAWLGGFAHPTGYPLYLMLGWLWTHLVPLRDPAFRMNLFSAVCGGVAVGLFCLLVMRVVRFVGVDVPATAGAVDGVDAVEGRATARLIALGAALVFTFTPTFWSQAVIAEVYTLHAVFVAGLLLALLSWAEQVGAGEPARRRAYLVALLFGLSLTHHRSTILLIPAAVLFVVLVLARSRRRVRPAPRTVAVLLACLIAPLLLYLYIPLRAPHVAYYRLPLGTGESLALYDASAGGFLAHVSGSVFGSSLAAPHAGFDAAGLANRFVDEFSLNGVLLGLLGLATLLMLAVRARHARAWAALALTGVFFLAQVAFNLFYAIGDIFVFYIPAYLMWATWMAVGAWGLVRLGEWLFAGAGEQARWAARVAGTALVFAALVALVYRSAVVFWPQVQRASDDSARRAWDALLATGLPQGAVLVSNDRDDMVPFFYLSYVEGRRTDLTPLFPLIQPGARWANVGRTADAALATGRPVYLVKPMPGLEVKYDLQQAPGSPVGPLGPAVQVTKLLAAAPARGTDVAYGESIRLVGYEVTPQTLTASGTVRVTLYWQAQRPVGEDWTSFVQVLNEKGDKVGQSDHQPGGAFYPSSLWAAGERLRDVHEVAAAGDPGAGPHRLLVGLYRRNGADLVQLVQPQVVGAVEDEP